MKLRNKLLSLALVATVASTTIAVPITEAEKQAVIAEYAAGQAKQANDLAAAEQSRNDFYSVSFMSGVAGMVLAEKLSRCTYKEHGYKVEGHDPVVAFMVYAATQYAGWKMACAATGIEHDFASYVASQLLVGLVTLPVTLPLYALYQVGEGIGRALGSKL